MHMLHMHIPIIIIARFVSILRLAKLLIMRLSFPQVFLFLWEYYHRNYAVSIGFLKFFVKKHEKRKITCVFRVSAGSSGSGTPANG